MKNDSTTLRNVGVPKSDGTTPAVDVYLPLGDGPRPTVLVYTPYLKD
jgi:predicted acyl esterase